MTLERAREINSKLLDHGLFRFGLENHLAALGVGVAAASDVLDASTADISLQDMLTATEIIRGNNPEGPGTHDVVCDERLIAAIYVAYHFQAEGPGSIEPIVQTADGRMVIVVDQRCVKQEQPR